MVAQSDGHIKGFHQLPNCSQTHLVIGCGVHRGAMHNHKRAVMFTDDGNGPLNGSDVIHSRGKDDRFPFLRDMIDQGIIVTFTGTDFKPGNPHGAQAICRFPGKRRAQVDNPSIFAIYFQPEFFFFA